MLTQRSLKQLAGIVTGDTKRSPYRSGPQLVGFFNELGDNDTYAQGFPSRWKYAEEKIQRRNNLTDLTKIINSALDPRDFVESDFKIDDIIVHLNLHLNYDGFEIIKNGQKLILINKNSAEVDLKFKPSIEHLSSEFIQEQIQKCRVKINQDDFDGAITNARSLVEAVFTSIERQFDLEVTDYDGHLPNLYKRIQKHLNLSPDNDTISQSLKQTLVGFISIINGLSGLSNKMGDRHVRQYKPSKHHAILVVNSAMTLLNFILESYEYQKFKN
jgi:Abortive infection C-terminus